MLVGARAQIVPPMPYLEGLLPRMQNLQQSLEAEQGRKCYLIPVGGSNTVGLQLRSAPFQTKIVTFQLS